MRYLLLGKSGLAVSELCLGTMTFGSETPERDAIEMVRRYLDRGGNFLDTADLYVQGRSEEIVGKAIKGVRQDVVLASKVYRETGKGRNDIGLSRKHIMDAVEASLRRLGTDYLDLYQVHLWDAATPLDETIRTLDDLVAQGKVRYIGCSNFTAWQLMKSLDYSDFARRCRYISIQQQYSLVSREMDRELMELCRLEQVGVIPWAPLGSGFLTGKYREGAAPASGRLAAAAGEASWANRNKERNFRILDEVRRVASEAGKTEAQTALRWLLQHPGIASPIFGASTLEQFENNMGALGWSLDSAQWERLDRASCLEPEYPQRFIDRFARRLDG